MKNKIRVAIAGVGNCASSFIQGLDYYKENFDKGTREGIMTVDIGGYQVTDVEVVTAFDPNEIKVGQDLGSAIWMEPNNAKMIYKGHRTHINVEPCPVLDGLDSLPEIPVYEWTTENVAPSVILKEKKVDVLICYVPVGSEKAARYWFGQCLAAGVDFINAMPAFVCTDLKNQMRAEEAGIRIMGDDIKSQVGATIIHRTLVNLIKMRGQTVTNSYQLNFGGNMDFKNMLDRTRLKSKEISKTQAVTSQLPIEDIKIGPSDYVSYLKDEKICYININGKQFGGVDFSIEMKLNVQDSPNSAGVMLDAVRACKLAKDKEITGYLNEPSTFCFKSPQEQVEDIQAWQEFQSWIIRTA